MSKVHIKVHTDLFKKLFSEVKIYIPKKLVNGRLKPCVEKGCDWHVYYYYRNPVTNKMQKFIEKRGINRIKTYTDRKKAANNLKKALTKYLQEGYNPFEFRQEIEVEKEFFTVIEALNLAFNEKIKVWGEQTHNVSKAQFDIFINWLKVNKLLDQDIKELKKRHIILFLNYLTDENTRNVSAKTSNNYRALISSLIKKLVIDDILDYNFVENIPKLKENPIKNKPFSKSQLKSIKNYLIETDPYLHTFIKFVMYGFLRPIEVSRIQVKDIDLESSTITVRTKTEINATILIIDKLKTVLSNINIDYSKGEYHLFTPEEKPGVYVTEKEKSKADFFSRRFNKLKKDLELGNEYGIYSFRHTFTLDLFNSFLKQGLTQLEAKHKLMTITRHKSLTGLNAYLRDIGAAIPKDYSDDYTIDF